MTEMNSEMVQKGLSIILLISIMHACHSPENKNIPVQEDGDAIKNETNLRIQQIKEKSSSVFTSSKGYWEAVLENEMTMVYIPGGNFFMGTDLGIKIEQPMHQVYLDGYWIGKYPVTVGQFREFIEATVYVTDAEKGMGSWQWTGEIPGKDDNRDPWRPMPDGAWNNIYFEQGEDHPVGSVSWNDAIAYCRWLTENTGMPFVLPSEAQWEKAARGTDKRTFPWGNDLPDGSYTNIADKSFVSKYGPYTRMPDTLIDDGYIETSPVDAFPKGQSSYGVYDMAGNLGHWVYDVFDPDYYQNSPPRNPIGPESSVPDVDRVNRGGAWTDRVGVDINGELISPEHGHTIRSAMRTGDEQNSSDDHMEGNAMLSRNTNATIIAHDNTRKRLLEFEEDFWPKLTFNHSLSLHFNNEEIQAVSFPGGHTDNDIVIFFKGSKVVHMGDLFNSGKSSFPTADYTAGGNAFELVSILEKILPLIHEEAKIIAGHGPLSDKKDLIQTYEMIKETTSFVGSRLDRGMTVEEIINEGLPEKYNEWGYGYTSEKEWIRMIFGSYSR